WHFSPETLAGLGARAGLSTADVDHFSWEYGPYGLFQSGLARLGLGHVLYTDVLGPGRKGARSGLRMLQILAHAILAPPVAALGILSVPAEAIAAGAK